MEKLLKLINGKKAAIFAISGAINTYLLAMTYIDSKTAALIASILVILGGGANYANYKSKK